MVVRDDPAIKQMVVPLNPGSGSESKSGRESSQRFASSFASSEDDPARGSQRPSRKKGLEGNFPDLFPRHQYQDLPSLVVLEAEKVANLGELSPGVAPVNQSGPGISSPFDLERHKRLQGPEEHVACGELRLQLLAVGRH